MCGIAAFSLNPNERPINANRLAKYLLLGIEHRGRHATGAAWRDGADNITIQKKNITATRWVNSLSMPKAAQTAVLHTRFWTQGHPSNNDNNHPVRSGDYVGVHNGGVWNDDYLFSMVDSAPRLAEVDSEAIFAMLAYGDQHFKNLTHDTDLLEYVQGSAAIAYMSLNDRPDVLHVARLAQSPLVIAQTVAGSFICASTEDAILDAVKALDLDLCFMDGNVDEGTYFKVEQGIITETKRFLADTWTYKAPAKPVTAAVTPIHGERREWTPAGVKPARTYEFCDDCDDWLDWCDHAGMAADEALTVFTPGDSTQKDPLDEDHMHPLLDPDLLDLGHDIKCPSEEEWEFCHGPRLKAIDRWVESVTNRNLDEDHILETAVRLQAFTRPGDWVETDLAGQSLYGQVVSVPKGGFPAGDYILRLLLDKPGVGFNGMEALLVSRTATQFRNVNDRAPKSITDLIGTTEQGSLALCSF